MFLIAGLGNHGSKYHNTKHNFGFLLADELINKFKFESKGIKFNAELFGGEINNHKILLIKPQTFMNLSGLSIQAFTSFYKIPLEKVIILHDDLDLELVRIKTKIGGGNAGHNGLKDIDSRIGKNYTRIRLGIGRPENPAYEISDFVLSKFNSEELGRVEKINQKISENFAMVLEGKLSEFVNNSKL
jgi:PTH1 family peptidyl-tRNA hydrolase